ncbi:hypothetical protein L1049_028264 [Liquidambar formosana]|uniref:Uncharacterized protein n=1 Tax=Liquidambar formosana TaxID=63359 RepID=A0AAP0RKM6_LIQFO
MISSTVTSFNPPIYFPSTYTFLASSTSMATTSPLPDQQQPQESAVNNPVAASSSAWHNSGSIGPFFAVISVLTVLAILSCLLGRICAKREVTPLENKYGSCFGWLKRKCRRCMASDVEVGAKGKIAGEESNGSKDQDGVVV